VVKEAVLLTLVFLAAAASTMSAARAAGCDDPLLIEDRQSILGPCDREASDPGQTIERRALAHSYRARAFRSLGRQDEAFAAVETGLALLPNSASLIDVRGILRSEKGDIAGAWEDGLEAIRLEPDNPRRYQTPIVLCLDYGDLDCAGELIEQARSLDPGSVQLLDYKAAYHRRRGETDEQIQTLTEILATPRIAELHAIRRNWWGRSVRGRTIFQLELADAFSRRSDHGPAGALYDQLVATRTDAVTLTERAYFRLHRPAMAGQSSMADALKDADAALALDSSYARASFTRGLILHYLHRPEEALASLDRAIGIVRLPHYAWVRGRIRRTLGDVEGAISDFTETLELDPSEIGPRMQTMRKHGFFQEPEDPVRMTSAVHAALRACALYEGCW
jgi:tetratricopeptide (TPR) repeat protein